MKAESIQTVTGVVGADISLLVLTSSSARSASSTRPFKTPLRQDEGLHHVLFESQTRCDSGAHRGRPSPNLRRSHPERTPPNPVKSRHVCEGAPTPTATAGDPRRSALPAWQYSGSRQMPCHSPVAIWDGPTGILPYAGRCDHGSCGPRPTNQTLDRRRSGSAICFSFVTAPSTAIVDVVLSIAFFPLVPQVVACRTGIVDGHTCCAACSISCLYFS